MPSSKERRGERLDGLVFFGDLADAPGNGNGAAIPMILLYGLGTYFVLGLISAIAFVTFGVTKVLPYSMTFGARLLILPGAIALWPYVLTRWLKSRQAP